MLLPLPEGHNKAAIESAGELLQRKRMAGAAEEEGLGEEGAQQIKA